MKKIIVALLGTWPVLASAAPITISWTGSITEYIQYSSSGGQTPGVLEDSRISGSVTYDPETFAHLSGVSYDRWELLSSNGLDVLQTRTTWQNGTFVPNAAANSLDSFRAFDAGTPLGWPAELDSLLLQDQQSDGEIYQLLQLGFLGADMLGAGTASNPSPFTAPNILPGAYGSGRLQWQSGPYYDGVGYFLTFSIDSFALETVSVPEPAGLALLLSGLMGMMVSRKRRLS